jgi:hypothetical protein
LPNAFIAKPFYGAWRLSVPPIHRAAGLCVNRLAAARDIIVG